MYRVHINSVNAAQYNYYYSTRVCISGGGRRVVKLIPTQTRFSLSLNDKTVFPFVLLGCKYVL